MSNHDVRRHGAASEVSWWLRGPLLLLAAAPLLAAMIGLSGSRPMVTALDSHHSFRIFLIIGELMVIVWAIERANGIAVSDREATWWRQTAWMLSGAEIWLLAGAELLSGSIEYVSCYYPALVDYSFVKGLLDSARVDHVSTFVFLTVLTIAVVRRVIRLTAKGSKPREEQNHDPSGSKSSSDGELDGRVLRLWGQLAAFGIMILALFAFGLEIKDEKLQPKWEEVPAILIVFVLAELGVHLIAQAQTVTKHVKDAASASNTAVSDARAVVDKANEMSKKVGEINSAADTSIGALDSAIARHNVSQTVFDAGDRLIRATDLPTDVFWGRVADFIGSWVNLRAMPQDTSRCLVGELFQQFVEGPSETQGTVRTGDYGISCVTIDTAFTRSSAEWLRLAMAHRQEVGSGARVVVWALTALLPTDFVLPQLWWTNDLLDHDAPEGEQFRIESFQRFVSEVLKTCQLTDELSEYRRITILRADDVEASKVPNAWNLAETDEEVASGANNKATKQSMWRQSNVLDMQRSMNEWFIWDPRLLDLDYDLNDFAKAFARLANQAIGGGVEPVVRDLTPDQIESEFTKKEWDYCKDRHVLPSIANTDKHFVVFIGKPQTVRVQRCLYFAVSDKMRKATCPKSDVQKELGSYEELKSRPQGGQFAQVARRYGWMTLGEWYCDKLHAPGDAGGAWWAKLQDTKPVGQLALKWDDFVWHPLDLLLIGARVGKQEPQWFGAGIANLRFNDPACIVKLVTNKKMLEDISEVVRTLTGRFGDSPDNYACGTWDSLLNVTRED